MVEKTKKEEKKHWRKNKNKIWAVNNESRILFLFYKLDSTRLYTESIYCNFTTNCTIMDSYLIQCYAIISIWSWSIAEISMQTYLGISFFFKADFFYTLILKTVNKEKFYAYYRWNWKRLKSLNKSISKQNYLLILLNTH